MISNLVYVAHRRSVHDKFSNLKTYYLQRLQSQARSTKIIRNGFNHVPFCKKTNPYQWHFELSKPVKK